MPIGQADLENAVREGWARDEDNELSIDGYSATIQVTTDDGTSGLNLKNSTGAVSFSAMSNGDGYFANRLGVGTYNPETKLEVIGKTRTDELQVTTNAVPGYVLTSDGDGNATWQPTGAVSAGVSETTFQENKNAQEEINRQILSSIDGYAQNSTVTENKNAQEQINQSILQSLDGYAIRSIEDQRWVDSSQQLQDLRDSLDGYVVNPTFEENKSTQEEINHQVLAALDGYAQNSTVTEHYGQFSQAIQDIVSVIDGYSTDVEFAGLTNTITENNNQQQQINQSILKDLDGYETKISAQDNYDAIGAAINTIRKDLEDGYADISGSSADGYIAFFTSQTSIAGDNDLYFDRVNNQLQVSALKLTTEPNDGYILTSDSSGNATWQKNNSLDDSEHRQLDQLVHNIAEDSFEECTYSGAFITNITIWTNSDKIKKIREEQFTYVGAQVAQLITIQYNSNGDEVERITENYTYSGVFMANVSRSLT